MIHNASIEKYRTPVGAVTCGSEMMIRLYDVGQEVNKAEIIMYSESFHREYEMKRKKDCMEEHIKMTSEAGVVWYYFRMNRSPSSRQLKKYKFFLPVEIYLLAVFMQLASKFRVFPLALKFRDSFASVYCCSNLYNLRSFFREYLYR